MEQFIELDSLYSHLEKNAIDYIYSHQIEILFRRIRDLKHEKNEIGQAEIAQWEIDFFNFRLEKDEIKPMFSTTNDKGENVIYPTFDRFNDKAYEYLKKRLGAVLNPLLKARYSHILWHSPQKHANYAKIAIDSYLELVKIYEKKEDLEGDYGLRILDAVKNAYFIAKKIDNRFNDVKSEIKRLILEFNFDTKSSFALKYNLIKLMLAEKKVFYCEDYKGFDSVCQRISDIMVNNANLHAAIDMLLLGEQIDKKTVTKTHEWGKLIAAHYETLMNQAVANSNQAAQHFCQKAIENYKKIKDKEKVKELEKKYIEIRNSMKFGEFKTKIDLTEYIKAYKDVAQKLSEKNSEEIIKTLILNKSILPKYQDMEKEAEENSEEFILQSIMSTQIIDQRGHPAQIFSEEEESKYYRILWRYDLELKFNKIILIREIFLASIKKNKLTVGLVIDFLKKHSWLGKTISKNIGNGKQIQYNWLNLLAPSLNEYFYQINHYLTNPSYQPHFVLSIDSLTLKIEGLIRDICQFCDVTTFYLTKDAKKREIVREKDIHALLYEEEVKKLFDEDDLIFFKFLLVEQAGYNLRHKVAHGFMFFQEYNIDNIHLLILALLKLGKYDFVEKEAK